MTRAARWTGCLAAGLLLLLSGCTHGAAPGRPDAAGPAPDLKLVAFDSCAELLDGLRTAAKAAVGPYGFGGVMVAAERSGAGPIVTLDNGAPAAAPGALPPGDATPKFSGTNTHEVGVDEPDLVKTDGKRIVTVAGGVLRVVDAASRRLSGSLSLDLSGNKAMLGSGANLLLAGDRALV